MLVVYEILLVVGEVKGELEGEREVALPMYQKHPRIISREAPHRTRIRINHNRVPAHGDIIHNLCAVPHRCVSWGAVDDLELVAVHVPRVGARVEIIDYHFDAVLMLVKEERREGERGLAFGRMLLRMGWWLIRRWLDSAHLLREPIVLSTALGRAALRSSGR